MYNAFMKRIHEGPLARVALKDRVADLIKDAILSGKLGPGDRIVELALANQLGVGTTAVREALFDLESQGFVNRVTNKGTFVTKLDLQDVEEILRVRRELEGLAVELAQERRTEEDLALLEECTGEMVAAARDGDWPRFYRNDLEFHRNIWRIAGNRYLAKSLDVLVVPLFAFFIMKIRRDPGELKWASVEKHVDIVRALRDGHEARKYIEASLGYFGHYEGRMLFGEAAEAHKQ
jgi:DNA-binding GntR family transcriptional regulator